MKKHILQLVVAAIFVLGSAIFNDLNADNKRPPRPEKIEEVQSDRPSEYHTWISGRWKWKNKQQEWIWRDGHWKFDHDLYAWKNRHSFYRNYHYRPYRYRYYAIPLGGGYYRIVAF